MGMHRSGLRIRQTEKASSMGGKPRPGPELQVRYTFLCRQTTTRTGAAHRTHAAYFASHRRLPAPFPHVFHDPQAERVVEIDLPLLAERINLTHTIPIPIRFLRFLPDSKPETKTENMDATKMKQLRRVRTLGRGASGAVVWLASDEASGELLAVKSVDAGGAAQLRREGRVLEGLCSPHIVPCLGSRAAAGGEYQLFLEFAPGGSLADEAARSGGRLAERDIRAYAGDVARGLAYLHGLSLVHGDVKARNVVIGGDGRARLTDFGCARPVESSRPIGGTPAFMAPEVARGEEQGPAADVWALGCMVIEMATGHAPWSDMDDVLAAVHRIGYTDAVPEVPAWLSAEAKDFLGGCFMRRSSDRSTAAQLVAHAFVASAVRDRKAEPARQECASPKTTLHDAFWDSDTDEEADEMSTSPAERIGALACTTSVFPDWDSDDGWIDVQDDHTEAFGAPLALTEAAAADYFVWAEPSDEEFEQFAAAADVSGHLHLPYIAGATDATISQGSFRGCKIPHTFDRAGTETGGSHRVCNRSREKIKRIPPKISLFAISRLAHHCLHVRTVHVAIIGQLGIKLVEATAPKRRRDYCFLLRPIEIEHVHERQSTPSW
ncbi:spindle assembly checkpoint kinase-like [Phragmites australis]|uniref:spindle assembly checkpoint kinase-like n=1 Tax=Phragmites australis TaxID=29695 RepID=UPI002D79B3CC|nr:spindle assembly checkpoint kinase-like [Phragmites australis]